MRRAPLGLLVALVAAGTVVSVSAGLAAGTTKTTPVGVSLKGGCKGEGTAYKATKKHKVLDAASAPEAPGASSGDPFKVTRTGTVAWSGSTPVVFTDHHWWVHVDGFPIRSGGSRNGSQESHAAGVVKVSSYLPSWLGLTGTYYVNGQISGVGGSCSGALYVTVTGDPATGVLLWAGIVFVFGGIALLMASRPKRLAVLREVPQERAEPAGSTWRPGAPGYPSPPPPSTGGAP
jgi:hypothetical protein